MELFKHLVEISLSRVLDLRPLKDFLSAAATYPLILSTKVSHPLYHSITHVPTHKCKHKLVQQIDCLIENRHRPRQRYCACIIFQNLISRQPKRQEHETRIWPRNAVEGHNCSHRGSDQAQAPVVNMVEAIWSLVSGDSEEATGCMAGYVRVRAAGKELLELVGDGHAVECQY